VSEIHGIRLEPSTVTKFSKSLWGWQARQVVQINRLFGRPTASSDDGHVIGPWNEGWFQPLDARRRRQHVDIILNDILEWWTDTDRGKYASLEEILSQCRGIIYSTRRNGTTCSVSVGTSNKWIPIPGDLFCRNGLIVTINLNEGGAKYRSCKPPPLSLQRYVSCRPHTTYCYPAVCNNTITDPLPRHTKFIFHNRCIRYYVFGAKRGCIIFPFLTNFMVQFSRPLRVVSPWSAEGWGSATKIPYQNKKSRKSGNESQWKTNLVHVPFSLFTLYKIISLVWPLLPICCRWRRLLSYLITFSRILWTRNRPVAETSTWQHTTLKSQTSMPQAGFEPRNPSMWAAYILDRAATGIGS
jgi:hypothetical protein